MGCRVLWPVIDQKYPFDLLANLADAFHMDLKILKHLSIFCFLCICITADITILSANDLGFIIIPRMLLKKLMSSCGFRIWSRGAPILEIFFCHSWYLLQHQKQRLLLSICISWEMICWAKWDWKIFEFLNLIYEK